MFEELKRFSMISFAVAVVAAVCFVVLALGSQRFGCFPYVIVSFGFHLGYDF